MTAPLLDLLLLGRIELTPVASRSLGVSPNARCACG
jgi:hypothetical protein